MPDRMEQFFAENRKRQTRFTLLLAILFGIVIGLECYRMFVLDAKVDSLVRRLNRCEVRSGQVIPLGEGRKIKS